MKLPNASILNAHLLSRSGELLRSAPRKLKFLLVSVVAQAESFDLVGVKSSHYTWQFLIRKEFHSLPRDLKELRVAQSPSAFYLYHSPTALRWETACVCVKMSKKRLNGFFFSRLLFRLANIKHIWQRRAILLFNHLSSKWQTQYNSLAQKHKFKLPR